MSSVGFNPGTNFLDPAYYVSRSSAPLARRITLAALLALNAFVSFWFLPYKAAFIATAVGTGLIFTFISCCWRRSHPSTQNSQPAAPPQPPQTSFTYVSVDHRQPPVRWSEPVRPSVPYTPPRSTPAVGAVVYQQPFGTEPFRASGPLTPAPRSMVGRREPPVTPPPTSARRLQFPDTPEHPVPPSQNPLEGSFSRDMIPEDLFLSRSRQGDEGDSINTPPAPPTTIRVVRSTPSHPRSQVGARADEPTSPLPPPPAAYRAPPSIPLAGIPGATSRPAPHSAGDRSMVGAREPIQSPFSFGTVTPPLSAPPSFSFGLPSAPSATPFSGGFGRSEVGRR
jgi:hypothetical protein